MPPAQRTLIVDQYGRPMTASYRADYVQPDLAEPLEFGEYRARLLRYSLFWGFYCSRQYHESVNSWAERYKHDEKMYRHVRAIFSVGYRLGEFWATHLLGGPLDFDAGDGVTVPSALPIVTDDPGLRAAIARLWRDSRWAVEKDSLARQGAVKGDAFIEACPNFASGRVRLRSVNPEQVIEVEKDRDGLVVGCTIWEERRDPEDASTPHNRRRKVEYHRTMTLRGGGVDVYTYRDRVEYDWGEAPGGVGTRWTLDVPFVPLWHVEHRDLGFEFGGSELAGVLGKIAESDGLGSNLGDWVYRALNGPRLMSGVKASEVTIQLDDRQKMPVYFTPTKDAKVQTMLDPLPVGETSGFLMMLLESIEHDHPELAIDRQRASGDMSGKSLREGRKPAETRVKSRRAGYDLAMVDAHRGGIELAATYGFPGYEAFRPGDMEAGNLDHQVGDRDVFLLDPFDRLEEQTGRFTMAQAARAAGLTVEDALARAGVSGDEALRARAEMQRMELMTLLMKGLGPADQPGSAAAVGQALGLLDPATAGALAQFSTAPDATQTETRATT